MAQIQPKEGKYNLGGPRDTDLEGINENKYSVYTAEDKLAAAQQDFPALEGWNWFASYTIRENGKDVPKLDKEYTIKFDKPDRTDSKLYYYLQGSNGQKGTVHQVDYDDTDNKGNKKRVKAKLTVGDPPMGSYP
jgi:hypothetical protein